MLWKWQFQNVLCTTARLIILYCKAINLIMNKPLPVAGLSEDNSRG